METTDSVTFNPKVSIIIPVYNGSNYLREAIDSALSQTYKNIEVIVVNDGSNDGGKTEAIAKSYGDNIRYFSKENGGVASALNLGIREMTGDWFAWLSHDDLFSPDRIDEDINVSRKRPDARVVFCRKRALINDKGKVFKRYEYPFKEVKNPWETLLQNSINMCTMTIHRSCFEKTGLFNESNRTIQDVEMTLLLAKYYNFYSNDKAVAYLREHLERGIYRLKEQHVRDRLALSEYLMNNFTFQDFFPNSSEMNKKQLAGAWSFLGNMYCYLGAYKFADKCYKEAFSLYRRPFSRVGIKYIVGARKIAICINISLTVKKIILYYLKISL